MRKRSVSLTSSVINVELALVNVMRATNVQQVHPVLQAVRAVMANQVKQANPVNRAKIIHRAVIAAITNRIRIPDQLVKDHPVHPAQPVPLEIKALQVRPEIPEKEAALARLARRDPPVQPEEMANRDRKDPTAKMPPEDEARKDPKDPTARSVNPDPKDQTVHQPPVAADLVNLDQLVHPVPEVRTEIPANKARKVHPAIPAQTPNIVLAHHEADWSIVVALSLFFAISTKKKKIQQFPWKRRKLQFLSSSI